MKKTTTISDGVIEILAQENTNSIEVSKNAKGDYTWSIKLYSDAGEELPDRIKKIDRVLRKMFKEQDEAEN